MELERFEGKDIRIHCIDNQVIEGHVTVFTAAINNEPEIDSITIRPKIGGLIEVTENEIKSIEIL